MYIEYFSVTYPLDIKVNFRFILGNVRGKINMDEFYQDLLEPVVYRWVKTHEHIKVCENQCTLCIDGSNSTGIISFHNEGIVELSVKNKDSDEILFYLHFQMHDMNSSLQQFNTFFHYLTTPSSEHHDMNVHQTDIKKILLSCSGGLTTSYFAYSIQEMMNHRDLGIQVDAVGYSDIDNVANEYDIILLAPQIAYMLPEYREKYGNKVMTIETVDFATSDFEGIIQKALNS